MTEVVVHLDGQDVAVRDLGGAGPDVMLLHGLGTNLASWDRVVPTVSDRFRVVLVDLPGHGRSTVPETHSFDGDLGAVDAVRSTLDLPRPAVVGHSYGGMLAVALAADRPGGYRVAVNIDGTVFLHRDTPAALRTVWEADEDPWPDVGDAQWMAAELVADEQELAAARVPAADLPDEFLPRGFAGAPDGTWSRRPPAAHYLAVARGLRHLDLPGGHYGLLEEPAAVANLLLDVCG